MEELRELAAFAAALREESIPTTARCAAACCVLDTVSAGAGASDDPLVRRATEELLPLYGTGGDAELWGRARSAPLHAAVFLNALASHTLELDDVHTASKTHIGTVVIPAAWGLARRLGVRGPRLVTAVVAGYETAARVGMALGVVSHRKRGFHATGTAGVFGAAAACGNLLGLDEEHMLSALGMAGTQASGVWAFLADGATCKALHPARAAANGLAAAYLARAGMTGPSGILAAEDGGLFAAMTDAPEPCRLNAGLGETWEILRLDRKPYPCCRSTHCAIDGALALRAEHGL
ncbi:MAG TPA: MmgE/PrpD family protein, partial [Clostridia bacterium]|nr:MmgE/PrpD family protein [Clostridia bacterium]